MLTMLDVLKATASNYTLVIYSANRFKQFKPFYKGTREELLKKDADEEIDFVNHLGDEVLQFFCEPSIMFIILKSETYELSEEDNPSYKESYKKKWKSNDANTRPYLWRRETELCGCYDYESWFE